MQRTFDADGISFTAAVRATSSSSNPMGSWTFTAELCEDELHHGGHVRADAFE